MSVIAPYILQGGRVEPYCSLTEVKFSPTAAAVDFSNLVENGAQTAQDRALSELITRASAKIDTYCLGQYGTLCATSSTENGRYKIDRFGRFKIAPAFKPVIEVTNFTYGANMGQVYNVPVSTQNTWIEREHIVFQAQGAASVNAVAGMQALSWIIGQPQSNEYYCEWTYVNGWANSFTTATSNIGDTAISVKDATGFVAGQNFTLWDGMNDEYCQVASTYTTGNTLPLVTGLQYKHGSGCNASTLPATVKQACIHFVVGMVKDRGQGGVVLTEMGADTIVAAKSGLSQEDELRGYDLLDEFKSVWGRT